MFFIVLSVQAQGLSGCRDVLIIVLFQMRVILQATEFGGSRFPKFIFVRFVLIFQAQRLGWGGHDFMIFYLF